MCVWGGGEGVRMYDGLTTINNEIQNSCRFAVGRGGGGLEGWWFTIRLGRRGCHTLRRKAVKAAQWKLKTPGSQMS